MIKGIAMSKNWSSTVQKFSDFSGFSVFHVFHRASVFPRNFVWSIWGPDVFNWYSRHDF